MSDYLWNQERSVNEPQPPDGGHTGQRIEDISQKASERARQVRERARGLGGSLLQGTQRVRILAAEGLTKAADTLRSSATQPDSTARRFADNLERSAAYLRRADVNDIQRDLKALVRRYPAQALGIAFVTGLALGRRLGRDRGE